MEHVIIYKEYQVRLINWRLKTFGDYFVSKVIQEIFNCSLENSNQQGQFFMTEFFSLDSK